MKILYYDCFCGISGDMNLAALLDLGVDRDYLLKELSGLGLDSEYEIEIKKDLKKGISGTKVDVVLKKRSPLPWPPSSSRCRPQEPEGHRENNK